MEVLNARIDGDRAKPLTPVVAPAEVPMPAPEVRRTVPVQPAGDGNSVDRPVPEWQKAVDQKTISTLEDPKATIKDKVAAFNKLYEQGEKRNGHVRVVLNDGGVKREFDIQRASVGKATQLMQVTAAGEGAQRPVLRWTERNGEIEQQRDRKGNVDFHGKWWNTNMPQSTVGQYGERGGTVAAPVRVESPAPVIVESPAPVRVDQPADIKREVPPVEIPSNGGPEGANIKPMPLDPVRDPKILNDIGFRPNGQKVEPTYIGYQGTITYADDRGKRRVQADQPLWLDRPAAEALALANSMLAAKGKRIILASEGTLEHQNSAGRTHTQQRIALGIRAKEGRSWHEKGSALDIENHTDADVAAALKSVGWVGKNIKNDEHHYQFEAPQKAARLWAQHGAQVRMEIEVKRNELYVRK